ncbi:unnamed protein product [Polarella glacialis]|uniref:valine--tRNA ligase n=1 Tax=Polarella glacialis TaxID=89957 RepID=A0A813JS46_POLGL|nr:unnamed protein product [Polarella glacialis]
MRGDRTLWLPGTDHAGIATQMLVERQLVSEGTTRQKVGRDEFLRRVWEWKGEKGGAIVDQLRRLGASADWSREQFTLNEQMSASVVEAFCRMHEMGIIFRGKRMVTLLQLVLFFICLLLLLVFGLVLLIFEFIFIIFGLVVGFWSCFVLLLNESKVNWSPVLQTAVSDLEAQLLLLLLLLFLLLL